MRNKITILGALLLSCLAASAYADTNVDQADKQFSVEEVAVKPGDSVHFSNKDSVTHNIKVINGDGETEDKGLQKPGDTINVKFDKPGEYQVRCGIHPSMKLAVSVK